MSTEVPLSQTCEDEFVNPGMGEQCQRPKRFTIVEPAELRRQHRTKPERRLLREGIVEITLTSTLTSEDENIIAPAILKAVTSVLDHLPIAYRVRIDTADSQTYQHSGPDRARLTQDGRFRTALRPGGV